MASCTRAALAVMLASTRAPLSCTRAQVQLVVELPLLALLLLRLAELVVVLELLPVALLVELFLLPLPPLLHTVWQLHWTLGAHH